MLNLTRLGLAAGLAVALHGCAMDSDPGDVAAAEAAVDWTPAGPVYVNGDGDVCVDFCRDGSSAARCAPSPWCSPNDCEACVVACLATYDVHNPGGGMCRSNGPEEEEQCCEGFCTYLLPICEPPRFR